MSAAAPPTTAHCTLVRRESQNCKGLLALCFSPCKISPFTFGETTNLQLAGATYVACSSLACWAGSSFPKRLSTIVASFSDTGGPFASSPESSSIWSSHSSPLAWAGSALLAVYSEHRHTHRCVCLSVCMSSVCMSMIQKTQRCPQGHHHLH